MKKGTRFWELDVLRALGLGLMLVQHTTIIWHYLGTGLPNGNDIVDDIGRCGAVIFLFLVGMSGYLSYEKQLQKKSFSVISRAFLWRGVSLLGWGLVLTIVSYLVVPFAPIVFGVLSFIGFCVIFIPYFCRYEVLSWILGIISLLLGLVFSHYRVATFSLLLFGLYPHHFQTLDYWPIFPWLSLVLLGLEVSRRLYKKGKRQFAWKEIDTMLVRSIAWIGSHTLLLYLLHIPILYALLSIMTKYL